jgi:outer membrane lipoprotein-sorting protein
MLMKFSYSLFAVILALLPAGVGVGTQAPNQLAVVLAQMDKASEQFKVARADFSQDYFERVSRDTTNDSGSVYFERKGGATQMGLVTVKPGGKDKEKVVNYKDGMLRIYTLTGDPQIRLIKSGANQGLAETFLTLGFGGSGKALAAAWDITDQGSETLTDGGQPVKTEKLDLVSKDASVQKNFTHVTIWIDPVRDVSLKQIFETPSHDKRTTIYSHIKLNGSIDTKYFEIPNDKKIPVIGP